MIAVAALALDAAFGWPDRLYRRIGHPVGGFAWIIAGCAARWNQARQSAMARRIGGIATVALLLAISGGGAWLIQYGLQQWLGRWAWLAIALAAFPALAQRSLYDHVTPVLRALARLNPPPLGEVAARRADGGGELPDVAPTAPSVSLRETPPPEGEDLAPHIRYDSLSLARSALSKIVGRDTACLDEPGIARAAIESLAESFCDGVVAPLFWLLIAGLPGIWAYKAINTADSLIGHKEPPWRDFGWAAARLDDLLNLVPARLAGVLLCLAGGGGWRTMWRDCRRHASPNAGWPEAAMAGALGIRLAGPARYDGEWLEKPWIGAGGTADAPALYRALRLYRRACAMLWAIALVWAAPWPR